MKLHNDAIKLAKGIFPKECQPLVWLTGGGPRDLLLKQPVRDIDLTAALPAETLGSLGFRPVSGKTTPDIWFYHDRETGVVEVTRLEDAGRLVYDLARRDFTINAMAMTLAGELIDPLDGATDLKTKSLRICSPSSFHDDPVRIFRGFRFETEGWRLTAETEKIIRQQSWEHSLGAVPVERFTREMLKALVGDFPGHFFRQMLDFEVGKGFLPELFRMRQIPAGPLEYHPEGDLLTHSQQVLERTATVTASALARFSAFFHDIGKLSTTPALYPKHHGHEEAGFRSAPLFTRRLALPSEYGVALSWVSRLHGNLNRFEALRDATRIRIARQAVKAGIADLLPIVAEADKPGTGFYEEWRRALHLAVMSTAELGIDGAQLLLLLPEQRAAYIQQKRVEKLRKERGQNFLRTSDNGDFFNSLQ